MISIAALLNIGRNNDFVCGSQVQWTIGRDCASGAEYIYGLDSLLGGFGQVVVDPDARHLQKFAIAGNAVVSENDKQS